MIIYRKIGTTLPAVFMAAGLQACANPEEIIVDSAMEGMQQAASEQV